MKTLPILLLLLISGRPAHAARDPGVAVRAWVNSHQREIVSNLARLVAIPNVRADSAGLRRNAETLRDMFRQRGFTMEIVETPGAPLVVGGRTTPGAKRTLLLYAHYDGQPVNPAGWSPPAPFTPVLRAGRLEDGAREVALDTVTRFDPEWRLYGRSASDDKAPIVAMLAALDALASSRIALTSNLEILLDGEEESGSGGLVAALPALRERLKSDLLLFFDGPAHASGKPTVVYGVRGIVTLDVTVYGPRAELHSGHYGNWVPNPASRLAALLASMKDDAGRVQIAGFYDGIAPFTPAEEAMLRAVNDDTTALLRQVGIASPDRVGPTLQHALQYPSLNVRGLASAGVGEEARTVIPDRATAAIDIRLVPETRAADMVEKVGAHARARGFHVVTDVPDDATRASHRDIVRIVASRGTESYRTDPLGPDSKRVAEALARAHGAPPVLIRTMGGTLPIAPIAGLLRVPAIVIPTVNFDNHQHSDNENVRLGHLFTSVVTVAALLAY